MHLIDKLFDPEWLLILVGVIAVTGRSAATLAGIQSDCLSLFPASSLDPGLPL
jgi:hypothetical protein